MNQKNVYGRKFEGRGGTRDLKIKELHGRSLKFWRGGEIRETTKLQDLYGRKVVVPEGRGGKRDHKRLYGRNWKFQGGWEVSQYYRICMEEGLKFCRGGESRETSKLKSLYGKRLEVPGEGRGGQSKGPQNYSLY